MSYSFNVRGADRTNAKEKVAAELAQVVAGRDGHPGQTVHSTEQMQVNKAIDSLIDLLPMDDTKDVLVTVSGSIVQGTSPIHGMHTSGIDVRISMSLVAKEVVPIHQPAPMAPRVPAPAPEPVINYAKNLRTPVPEPAPEHFVLPNLNPDIPKKTPPFYDEGKDY